MSYTLRLDPAAYAELEVAIADYLTWRHDSAAEDYFSAVRDDFRLALDHPEALPKRYLRGSTTEYRRVIILHFIFLYRIDATREELVIDRILHERSRIAQDLIMRP